MGRKGEKGGDEGEWRKEGGGELTEIGHLEDMLPENHINVSARSESSRERELVRTCRRPHQRRTVKIQWKRKVSSRVGCPSTMSNRDLDRWVPPLLEEKLQNQRGRSELTGMATALASLSTKSSV